MKKWRVVISGGVDQYVIADKVEVAVSGALVFYEGSGELIRSFAFGIWSECERVESRDGYLT